MEADRWLGLDLRHLVALKTIADDGVDGARVTRGVLRDSHELLRAEPARAGETGPAGL